MESKYEFLSKLVVAEFKWLDAIVLCNYEDAQIWRNRCIVLIAKIEMENHNVSISEKRRLGAKLDCALKELEKARESGDVSAIVAAKANFREVQEEIRKAYGE